MDRSAVATAMPSATPTAKSSHRSDSYPIPTGREARVIARARLTAQVQLNRAINSLERLDEGRGRKSDKRNFKAVFGELSPSRLTAVYAEFRELRRRMPELKVGDDGVDVRVAPANAGECTVPAYRPRGLDRIVLCPDFFAYYGRRSQALTLIHELGHVLGHGSDLYNDSRVFALLASEPELDDEPHFAALRNAESFEEFAAFSAKVDEPDWVDKDGNFIDRQNIWKGADDPQLQDLVRRALAYAEQWVIWTLEVIEEFKSGQRAWTDGSRKLFRAVAPDPTRRMYDILVAIEPTLESIKAALGPDREGGANMIVELTSCASDQNPRYFDGSDYLESTNPGEDPTANVLKVGPQYFVKSKPVDHVRKILRAMLEYQRPVRDIDSWLLVLQGCAELHTAEIPLGPEPPEQIGQTCEDGFEDL